MRYFLDRTRHLVCHPYTVANLHIMAQDLGIKQAWFDPNPDHPHYDVPYRRFDDLVADARVELVRPREILSIIRGDTPPPRLQRSQPSNARFSTA